MPRGEHLEYWVKAESLEARDFAYHPSDGLQRAFAKMEDLFVRNTSAGQHPDLCQKHVDDLSRERRQLIMGILIQLFTSDIIEPVDDPEVHTVDIQGVLPGDFCGISINQFSGPGGTVEILRDVVERVAQGPGPQPPGPYTIRHTVTLRRATDEVVQCNLVGVLIHQP